MKNDLTNVLSRSAIHCFCVMAFSVQNLSAQSALPLLSGFDQERLESVYPILDEPTASEAAKLVYRLRRIDPSSLGGLVVDDEPVPGDAYKIDGVISEIGTWPLSDRMAETLEFQQLQEILIETNDKTQIRVMTTGIADDASDGDRLSGVGVLVSFDEAGNAVAAAGRLNWFPREAPNAGISMLTERGVDAAAIMDMATRDRLPLMAEDAEAFYAVLRAADEISRFGDTDQFAPLQVDPVALLRDPGQFGGQWLRMRLNTVRVTRIAVSDPRRREQLGSDHYFQIDASGELDNVVVSIARPAGDPGEPIQFESSYPVSLAIKQLPAFLRDAITEQDGGGAISTMISVDIRVYGFFLRLWSYESDFMQRRGGGKQFGPLIIASRIENLEPTTADPAGVRMIGWLAAAGVVISLVAIAIWSRLASARDHEVNRQRKIREAEQLQLPTDLPD